MTLVERVKMAALPVTVGAMTLVPSVYAFASEPSGSDVNLSSITTEAVAALKGDMLMVIGATTGVAVALIGITVGVSFLLKRLKGLKSQAS